MSTTALHAACARNDYQAVVDLIAEGADLEARKPHGATPLWVAAERGFDRIAGCLLEAGADVNTFDKDNATALYIAAQNGQESAVRQLILHNADPNVQKASGATPLLIAAQEGHVGIVRALYEAGADINIGMSNGITPFIASCFKGHAPVAALLASVGCDTMATAKGKHGLLWALDEGHCFLISCVLQAKTDRILLRRYYRRFYHWLEFVQRPAKALALTQPSVRGQAIVLRGLKNAGALARLGVAARREAALLNLSPAPPSAGSASPNQQSAPSGTPQQRSATPVNTTADRVRTSSPNPAPTNPPRGSILTPNPAKQNPRESRSAVTSNPDKRSSSILSQLDADVDNPQAAVAAPAPSSAPIMQANEFEVPTREELKKCGGWLYKRGGALNMWRRRWFTISRALGQSEIDYRSKPEGAVLGSIWIKDIEAVGTYDLQTRKERPPKSEFGTFAFTIQAKAPKSKTYLVCATSEGQLLQWLNVLPRCVAAEAASANGTGRSKVLLTITK